MKWNRPYLYPIRRFTFLRYSGCHDYDVSALNVVLGRHFGFDEGRYVAEHRFFARMSEDLETDLDDAEDSDDNATSAGDGDRR